MNRLEFQGGHADVGLPQPSHHVHDVLHVLVHGRTVDDQVVAEHLHEVKVADDAVDVLSQQMRRPHEAKRQPPKLVSASCCREREDL